MCLAVGKRARPCSCVSVRDHSSMRCAGKGTLDMAVLSTDGAIAEIAQGANFKIVAPFVTSPLRYGVFVSASQGAVRTAEDLEGGIFAVSRKGSLSHVMTYLHSQQASWNPRNWDRTGSMLLEVGNLAGAVAAVREGRAHAFLWEIGSAQHLVERGDLAMLSECAAQWPSFVLAVRNEVCSVQACVLHFDDESVVNTHDNSTMEVHVVHISYTSTCQDRWC